MSDSLFPSGPWTGFYNYAPGARHGMDLNLTFAVGRMTGDGVDDIGRFAIKGHYDAQTLECYWTKTYLGAHDVFYRGFREGKGIWGTWEITVRAHGGFHIWPKQASEGQAEAVALSKAPSKPERLHPAPNLTLAAPRKLRLVWLRDRWVKPRGAGGKSSMVQGLKR